MRHDILEYGAAGDGRANDAAAIQRAIDACAAAGGGTVLVPSGRVYFCGSIALKPRVELHLERGATLLASGDYADYPRELESDVLTGGLVDETELPRRAFITAYGAHDAAITGGGVIDGNGRAFVETDLGHIYVMKGADQYFARPYTLHLIGCEGLTVRDVIIRDGAFWTLRLTGCEDVVVHGVRIRNDTKLPNNDAIDLDRCRRVRISDCDIVSGDDAICLKTCRGTAAFGPCEDVTVTGCTLMSTSSALKIGNECCAPIRNVVFDACVVRGTHRGLSVHVGEPGDVENVLFSNIVLETRLFHESWWGRGEPIYVNSTPWREKDGVGRIRRLRFTNILARCENGAMIYAARPGDVSDVVLENVRLEIDRWTRWPGGRQDLRPREGEGMPQMPTHGFSLHNAHGVALRHCEVAWGERRPPDFGKAIWTENVSGLELEGFKGEDAHAKR